MDKQPPTKDGLLDLGNDCVLINGEPKPKSGLQLKTVDMEPLYQENDNPWSYRDCDLEVHRKMFNQFSPHLPKVLNVLDLGAGEGFFAENFCKTLSDRHTINYTCVDVSTTALIRAKSRLVDTPIAFNYKVCNFEEHPEEIAHDLQNSNLMIALEVLYYAVYGCTRVLKGLNEHITPGSHFLNADSLGIYVCREFLHKKLDYKTIDKFSHPMYKDKDNRTHSLIAFLDRKDV